MSEEMDRNPERFPEALDPLYHFPSPNTTIRLFEGDLKLNLASGNTLSTSGTIEWKWLPSPSIRFSCFDLDRFPDPSDLSEANLNVPALTLSCEVYVTSIRVGGEGATYDGRFRKPVLVGDNSYCDQVIFHLPNFFSFIGEIIRDKDMSSRTGRLRLESDEWLVTLDTRKAIRDLISSLKNHGGYAITHTGELRRSDSRCFNYDEADDVLQAVYFFLSFLRGLWCGPILAFGRSNNRDIWQEWATSRLTPWKYVESWFPCVAARENVVNLNQSFRGFMRKWKNGLWKDPIKHSIHWYVESNIGAGGVEGSIVLIQTALELLSWLYFVEDPATATSGAKRFEKVNAAEKIRCLLKASGISADIPVTLKQLKTEAVTLEAPDGPEAFVRLRNAIVHPKKSKREAMLKTSVLARFEAKNLGLWYLELILLRVFGYEGEYYQRLKSGWPNQGRVKVPWV